MFAERCAAFSPPRRINLHRWIICGCSEHDHAEHWSTLSLEVDTVLACFPGWSISFSCQHDSFESQRKSNRTFHSDIMLKTEGIRLQQHEPKTQQTLPHSLHLVTAAVSESGFCSTNFVLVQSEELFVSYKSQLITTVLIRIIICQMVI